MFYAYNVIVDIDAMNLHMFFNSLSMLS